MLWLAWSRRARRCGRQATKYGVPRICFVNKMDRMGANFFRQALSTSYHLPQALGLTALSLGRSFWRA